jgi:hypothetical protein
MDKYLHREEPRYVPVIIIDTMVMMFAAQLRRGWS